MKGGRNMVAKTQGRFLVRHSVSIALVAVGLLVSGAMAGGPIVLMGIDGEDFNGATGSNHGGKAPYISVIDTFLNDCGCTGGGILVIGGGKAANDHVTAFWNAIGAGLTPARTVTHVNGAANIGAQSFSGFCLIAVASSLYGTFTGGLTEDENNAFSLRVGDVAAHVNGGNALFGMSQYGLSDPFGYLGGGVVSSSPPQFSDVTATAAGLAAGINDTNMDVCCWHDEFTAFPVFLDVLATNNASGNACAIGGCDVIVVPECGDNLVNDAAEQCDGTDDAACPGQCSSNCQCPSGGGGEIPTASAWGIAVLCLTLLVGARFYFGRRETTAS